MRDIAIGAVADAAADEPIDNNMQLGSKHVVVFGWRIVWDIQTGTRTVCRQ